MQIGADRLTKIITTPVAEIYTIHRTHSTKKQTERFCAFCLYFAGLNSYDIFCKLVSNVAIWNKMVYNTFYLVNSVNYEV